MHITTATGYARSPRTLRPTGPGMIRRIVGTLSLSRQRRALSDLDDHLLADIGLTRTEAAAESQRRVWDAPTGWQQGRIG